jgi:hypothetical protein
MVERVTPCAPMFLIAIGAQRTARPTHCDHTRLKCLALRLKIDT